MSDQRLTKDYFGLWAQSTIGGVATFVLGWLFIADGKGTTGSPAYDPVKNILAWLPGVSQDNAIRIWGLVFVALGAHIIGSVWVDGRLRNVGRACWLAAIFWTMFSITFMVAAAQQGGRGWIGAALWLHGALTLFSVAATFTGYAARPRPRE